MTMNADHRSDDRLMINATTLDMAIAVSGCAVQCMGSL